MKGPMGSEVGDTHLKPSGYIHPMQKISLIAQSVLKLSHCEKGTQRQRQRRRRRHPSRLNYSPRRNVFRRGQKERKRKERLKEQVYIVKGQGEH